MTITNNWDGWISEHSKTRKVLAVEMQGHGRTADIPRDITYDNLAADVAALLKDLKIPRADLIGYSMGGAVAMQCAIRHPAKVRRAVIMSSTFRRDGMTTEGYDFGADKLKATTAPMFFIHGDADGVRLAHVAEMFRLKGGEIHGDIKPRSASRLAILPNTTHVTLLQRMPVIVPMVNGFLDAKP
jgi:pimeloyl-ACP methyl ester carboxylesterase